MDPKILKKLESITNIATIPGNALQIIQLINNPDASLKEISQLIERDMPLMTKILKIANSPFIGFAGEVATIQRALTILGLNQVKNIILAIALYSAFINYENSKYFDREKFWSHSFGTGQIARRLASKMGIVFQGEEFVAGTIHDIGKIILDQYFPEEFSQILELSKNENKPLLASEINVLGSSHCELGAWLLEKWKFPSSLISVVRYHHTPEKTSEAHTLVSIIQISEVLCELWGIGFDGDVMSCVIEDLSGWQIIKEQHPEVNEMDLEVMTLELYKEIETAKEFLEIAKS
ncbi:MAG: HDOD domain-containing protein [Calditrichia bacterium]